MEEKRGTRWRSVWRKWSWLNNYRLMRWQIAHFCLHITSCQSMEAWLGWSDSLLPFKTTIVSSVASQESHENCFHQMLDFKAKMHLIRFGLGLYPRWGSLQRAPPDLLAGFKGPYFWEREGEEKGRKGEGGERLPPPLCEILNMPLITLSAFWRFLVSPGSKATKSPDFTCFHYMHHKNFPLL